MKGIVSIFFIFVFGVLPIRGQTSHTENLQTGASHAQPDIIIQRHIGTSRYGTPATGPLIAQAVAPINSTKEKNAVESVEQVEETADKPTKQVDAPQQNSETAAETRVQWEKKRRILKVVNNYELAADEVLTTLVMIAGNARLHGRVTGNVLVIGGDVDLATGAAVNGTLHIIGGQASGNSGGVANLRVSNRWSSVPAAMKLMMHPHTFWGLSQQANFRLTFVKFGIFLLMYLLVAALCPKPINAVSELFARRPVGSLLFSCLMLAIIPLIFALLTLSIVGVPFMLLGVSLLLPLAICGKTAIFLTLGSTLFSGRLKPLAVLFGYLLYFMATALPYIDWITFLVVNTIGIGLCLLSGISMMRLPGPRRNIPWSEKV